MKQMSRDGWTRRECLRFGIGGLVGLSVADLLRLAEAGPSRTATADAVLFINLAGGPSHLDTLDMKPDGPSETRGEFQPISARLPGLVVCEHLPKIAAASDQLSILRGIHHTAGSHPQGQSYISTGNRPSPAVVYPSYGSIVARELPGAPDLPPYVAVPQTEWNAGYLGDRFAPFKTNAVPKQGQPFAVRGLSLPAGLTEEKVRRRERLLSDLDQAFRDADTGNPLLDALDAFGKQAHHMITSKRTQKAFDVALEAESVRSRFAKDELGQSLLLATRLVEFGVRFVTVTQSGWDTHLDNFNGHRRLMPPFDAGLTATLEVLREKGLLERTLVVAMGEFGRTPKINANVGRDHFPRANWCVMAGGGVQPGRLIGATDAGGEGPDDATDFKPDDIGATILHSLGIDHHKEYYTQSARPVSLIPHGRVVHELF